MTRTTMWKTVAATAIAAVALAGCADPEDPDGTTSGGDDGSSAAPVGEDLEVVEEVAALVPDEFKEAPIKNAIYNVYPPQEFMQGDTLVGIQPDLVAAMATVMGVEFDNAEIGNFDTLIPGVVSGRYDMSSADFGVTEDRLKEVDFVTEFQLGTAFAVKEGSGITVDSATDLCGHSVGVQSGSYFIDQLEEADAACDDAGEEPIDLQTFPDDGARVLALSNGRIEITATAQDAMAYAIDSESLPFELQSFVYAPLEQGIVIADGSDLGPAVQAAMQEIVENGTYLEILAKWGIGAAAYTSPDEVLYLTDSSQAP
jgi:polar amino acid transport system substrate-binding protein